MRVENVKHAKVESLIYRRFLVLFVKLLYFCSRNQKNEVMTALAKKISETPMAPYAELMRSMKPHEMRIVVTFLQEAMAEAEAPKESASEIIRKKFKRLAISQETKELVSELSLSSEEMNDERTRYILGFVIVHKTNAIA